MSSWRLGLLLLASLFSPCLSARSEPPNAAPNDDPLPPGAVARLGSPRFRHPGGVVCLAYAPRGDTVASAGEDATIRIWDMANGRELRRWRLKGEKAKCLAWSPDGKLLAAGGKWGIALWDPAKGQKVVQLDEGWPTVTSVAFAPDGKSFADGGADGIRLWDLASRKICRVRRTRQWVRSLAFTPDGTILLFGGDDGRIRLWDAVKGGNPRELGEPNEPIRAVACAPDNTTMASAAGKTVSLWDGKSGKRLALIKASEQQVNSVAFSPDGKLLASVGADGITHTWLARDGSELAGFGADGILRSVIVSPDSRTILSAGDSGSFHRLQLQIEISEKEINAKTVGEEELRIEALTFAPDGRSLAVRVTDGAISLWDIAHRKERGCLRDPQTPLRCLAFSPDAKILAASSDRVIHLWDTMSARELRVLPHTAGRAASITFSNDGKFLALAGSLTKDSGKRVAVCVLDLKRGKEIQKLSVPEGVELAMTFLPGGQTLATWSGILTFWDVATGADKTKDFLGADLPGGRERYPGLVLRRSASRTPSQLAGAFSPNGWLLATYSARAWGFIYDRTTGLERGDFSAYPLFSDETMRFSPDGRVLFIGIASWDVNTGERLPMLWDLQRPIDAWTLSPDGATLAAGMRDGTIELSDLRPAEWARVRKTGLQPWQWRRCWKDLLSSDACWLADRAAWMLAADAEQTLPLLKSYLHRFSTETRIRQLIRDLDSDSFATRQAATRELHDIGAAAEPALLHAWRDKPSLELRRRMKELLEAIERHRMARPTGERLRSVRAIGVLERIGTKEARAILEDLARGGEGAWETWEAQEALRRLRLQQGG
ncbi:MAG TPA: WD40 repeat domain-containing protein [Gemmataceae bacterium]